jgi:hypothetical protein
MIMALYKQNKRLLERAMAAEDKYDELVRSVELGALKTRAFQVCTSLQNSPTLVK